MTLEEAAAKYRQAIQDEQGVRTRVERLLANLADAEQESHDLGVRVRHWQARMMGIARGSEYCPACSREKGISEFSDTSAVCKSCQHVEVTP